MFLFSISSEFLIQISMTILPIIATWVKLSSEIAVLKTKVEALEEELKRSNSQTAGFTKDLLEVSKEVNSIANQAIHEVQKITFYVDGLQTNLQTMLRLYDNRIEKIESSLSHK